MKAHNPGGLPAILRDARNKNMNKSVAIDSLQGFAARVGASSPKAWMDNRGGLNFVFSGAALPTFDVLQQAGAESKTLYFLAWHQQIQLALMSSSLSLSYQGPVEVRLAQTVPKLMDITKLAAAEPIKALSTNGIIEGLSMDAIKSVSYSQCVDSPSVMINVCSLS